jgi:CCR4-NOT transcription complex subunit 6
MVVLREDASPRLERVKVLSWNILCERYATEQVYGYTPKSALEWSYRRELILDEIRLRNADFLCLQEISTDALREVFAPELAKEDYKCIHHPRSKARLMGEKEMLHVDGCAIFYKNSKYICLDKTPVDFQNIAINRPDMKNQHDIFNRVMPKDNIAIIALFESRETGARMIIVNTHLVWEGTLADVKIVQTALLMELVTKHAERYTRIPPCKDKKMIVPPGLDDDNENSAKEPLPEPGPSQEYRHNTDIPLFVCGDYNSTKDSGVYELLEKGHLRKDHPELAKYQYGNFTRDGIQHPWKLKSSYDHLYKTQDDMPFTNYTPTFANVIDYIWYSTNTMDAVELLGPPDPEYLKRVPGFPHYYFPADHIQIMGEFVIKPRKDRVMGVAGPSSS